MFKDIYFIDLYLSFYNYKMLIKLEGQWYYNIYNNVAIYDQLTVLLLQ